ncbi:MAG TPA: methylmalonyl-CoA mutase family protein, partial [Bacteroidia bacterium]|nr:methylmalonyl-CoA mutase family protein [Bacteroidia bacterium]
LIDFLAKGKIEEGKSIAILCVDPSKRKTGGALLGDRIRMNAIGNQRVYMRSMATRQSHLALSQSINKAVDILKACNFDLILLETSGIGQSDTEVVDCSDVSLYVMTPEYGAASQLEKIDMLDFADVIAINKFDKRGAQDALRDVKKQFKRNHKLFDVKDENLPVFGTIASQFNDPGMNSLYKTLMDTVAAKTKADLHSSYKHAEEQSQKIFIIPPERVRYLSEITETVRSYGKWAESQAELAEKLYALHKVEEMLGSKPELEKKRKEIEGKLTPENMQVLAGWEQEVKRYTDEYYVYNVRGKDIKVKTHTESLSHTLISKISVPPYKAWGEILHWVLQENFPGKFPYTAGVYPFKRSEEDPTRMFAGEGGPERTNKRFHYVSASMPAKRLSTAFDSVTLYGRDPDHRPDIYGKIGNSGVSICCLDDAKKLYSGFNLCDPKTSVSMTINGPASIIAAFFMNAAIDQQCELYIKEHKLEKEVQKKIDAIYKK